MQELKKVLVFRPRFLGDIILSTGLAEAIHSHNPEAEIWFLVEDPYQSVLQNHQQVAGILSLDPKQKDKPLYLLDFQKKNSLPPV
jgi:ADP-heptose:LPS heptosyltransferase